MPDVRITSVEPTGILRGYVRKLWERRCVPTLARARVSLRLSFAMFGVLLPVMCRHAGASLQLRSIEMSVFL